MNRNKMAPWRRHVAACALVLSFAVTGDTSAGGGGFVLRQSLVSNGGNFVHDDCYRLFSVFGEPVVGTISGGEFVLAAGFLAETPSTDDKLFRSGFEDTTGACK